MRRHVRTYAYNIHVHMRDCACAFHLRSHLGRDAAPSAKQIMGVAGQRRDVPYRDAACAPQRTAVVGERSWRLYMYVRSQFSFQFSIISLGVIQLTVVASLHRADVFRVRLGGHCKEFGVNPCSNVAYFSIRQSQSTV